MSCQSLYTAASILQNITTVEENSFENNTSQITPIESSVNSQEETLHTKH